MNDAVAQALLNKHIHDVATEKTRKAAYQLALRAVMLRHGGTLLIRPEELTDDAFAIFWRHTKEGGLEMKLEEWMGSKQ